MENVAPLMNNIGFLSFEDMSGIDNGPKVMEAYKENDQELHLIT